MVPLSNAEILASSSAQYISTTVQEVCWDSPGDTAHVCDMLPACIMLHACNMLRPIHRAGLARADRQQLSKHGMG